MMSANKDHGVLGYWRIRGLAEPIRMMLEHTSSSYENKYYVQGEGPEFSRESWLKEKHSLGLDFANLPYYTDGNVKLTESHAILSYIARRHNLYGSTNAEAAIVDMVLHHVYDMRGPMTGMCYSPNFAERKATFFKSTFPAAGKELATFLGTNHWFANNKLSAADFVIYEVLDVINIMEAGVLSNFPTLAAFHARFKALPRIHAYLTSSRHFARPINNTVAAWK